MAPPPSSSHRTPTVAVYVYDGWHPCDERDRHFGPGWTEWELVRQARPHFAGHRQPVLPQDGPYDDSDPAVHDRRIRLARDAGVDVFVHGRFWSRGKTVFSEALNDGYLRCERRSEIRFAVMWANRMPHRVLPIRVIDPTAPPRYRRVFSDPVDFTALLTDTADRYFTQPNYWRIAGRPYFSIFDTSLFIRQLGPERAQEAVARARAAVGDFHLGAIDPEPQWWSLLKEIGFDSVTHYVRLPDWKGPRLQDFSTLAAQRASEWQGWAVATPLPYFPSVSPGWDATPRARLYARIRPDRYPWTPIVTGTSPEAFEQFVRAAARWTVGEHGDTAPLFVASWNEWSEGHILEPDQDYGHEWLGALNRGRTALPDA